MSKRGSPYNPARNGPQIHDRRAKDVNRGASPYIVEVEIDDPYDPAARISAVRSVRDDPLADHFARGHIDEAQYLAGRAFQNWFGLAERGPRAMQMNQAVDGSPSYETLTDTALMASKWLARCHQALGRDGSVLMHDMLISNRTTRQIAAVRGMIGADWERYFARRLFECLDCLAIVFGLAHDTIP